MSRQNTSVYDVSAQTQHLYPLSSCRITTTALREATPVSRATAMSTAPLVLAATQWQASVPAILLWRADDVTSVPVAMQRSAWIHRSVRVRVTRVWGWGWALGLSCILPLRSCRELSLLVKVLNWSTHPTISFIGDKWWLPWFCIHFYWIVLFSFKLPVVPSCCGNLS